MLLSFFVPEPDLLAGVDATMVNIVRIESKV
jgi:hypothetical protein